MKRALPAFVYERKRGGAIYVYYERRGCKSQRIMAEPGTPEFALEYAKLLNGVQPLPKGRTFSTLVKSYRASKRFRELAPRTQRDYETVLEYIDQKLGHLPVAGMQRKDVIRAQMANAETVRFANYIVQVLRIILEHAINIGWLILNPAKGVTLIKSQREKREAWPADLVDAYRAAAPIGTRQRLIFELCIGTGQRIGDVLRMRWNDIEDGGMHVKQGKTGARLWIPITRHLQAAIDATPKAGMTIAAQANGRPTSYVGASALVREVRRSVGALEYDLHALRHTTTAELSEAGCDDELIMAVTGHTTTAMVRLYAGPARQKVRAKIAQGMRGEQNKPET